MKVILILIFAITFSQPAHSQSVYRDGDTGLWGAKDKSGDVIIHAQYDEMVKLDRLNSFRAIKDDNVYFFNSRGELLNKHYFTELGIFEFNAARIGQRGRYGVINEFGDVTIPIIYDNVIWPMWSYAAVSKNSKWGISDLSGNIIVPVAYDTIIPFPASVKYAIVKQNGLYGIIDMLSGVLTHKCEMEDYSFTRFNYIKGMKNGSAGLLHYDGTVLADFVYDEVRVEVDSYTGARYIFVLSGGKWGVLNSRGAEVFASDYDDIGAIDKMGLSTASKDGRNIMLDIRIGKEK